jgi:hypothetical protein
MAELEQEARRFQWRKILVLGQDYYISQGVRIIFCYPDTVNAANTFKSTVRSHFMQGCVPEHLA